MIFTVVQLFSSSKTAVGDLLLCLVSSVPRAHLCPGVREHKAAAHGCCAPGPHASIHQLDLCIPAPREGRMAAAAPVKHDAGQGALGRRVTKGSV